MRNKKQTEKKENLKAEGNSSADDLQNARQHDEKIFREGHAIFNENDLREFINYIYSEYQYKGSQLDKLVGLINFLALEENRFFQSELADQSERLSIFLNNFWDFLKSNFYQGSQTEDGEIIFFLNKQETQFETEAFLSEFQMLSLDVEKAYRDYRKSVTSYLKM